MRAYYIRHYGTPYPAAGAVSLTGDRHHHVPGGRCPWEGHREKRLMTLATAIRSLLRKRERTATRERAKIAAFSARAVNRRPKPPKPAPVRPTPPVVTKPRWTPTMVSEWEPGLDSQAKHEFHL